MLCFSSAGVSSTTGCLTYGTAVLLVTTGLSSVGLVTLWDEGVFASWQGSETVGLGKLDDKLISCRLSGECMPSALISGLLALAATSTERLGETFPILRKRSGNVLEEDNSLGKESGFLFMLVKIGDAALGIKASLDRFVLSSVSSASFLSLPLACSRVVRLSPSGTETVLSSCFS